MRGTGFCAKTVEIPKHRTQDAANAMFLFMFIAVLERVWVRRGKAQNSSGRVKKSTRQLALQPVAAEANMEAMKCSKLLVQKARQRVSEPAGRSANEHRASPETI